MQINTNLRRIEKVYHLADIHFPKNIVSDEHVHVRYLNMMNNVILDAANYKQTSIIVITGDLLNNNDQGSPDLIKLCIQFINKLGELMPVIIIAGNHDYNHTTHKTWFDVLDAATNDNVHFLSQSGFYVITTKSNNLLIGFQSITDKYYSFFYENQSIRDIKKQHNCNRAIALFHGNVTGTKVNTKIWSYDESSYSFDSPNTEYNVNKQWLKEYDLVLLGHIHERQKIEPNIYYAGSTIQRTFGESYDNHGGYIFNLANLSHIAVNYKDMYANITLNEIDAKLHVSLPYTDRRYFIKIQHTDSLSAIDRKEIEDFYNKHYIIVNIIWQYRSTADKTFTVSQHSNITNIFDDAIADYSQDVQDKLKKLHSNNIIQSTTKTGSSIDLKTLKWSNIFCYGSTPNKIDFENDITIISAPNTSGKSTIWRIILVALYADIDQRTIVSKLLENVVNKYASQGWIELTCNINNNECVILRQFKVNNSRCSHNYTITVNGIKRDKTWLKDNLIPYDILMSNYSLTKDSESIYSKTLGKLQKYINDTFNLEQISDQIISTTSKITDKITEFTALTAKRETTKSKLDDLHNIDIDDINNKIELYTQSINSLVKPVNKYKHFNNLGVTKGKVIDINIKPNEYNSIVTYYNTKKLNQDIIHIYSIYNEVQSEKDILSLYNTVEFSQKIQKYIDIDNISELANILNIPNNNLENMCWKDIQSYTEYIRDIDCDISDINIQDCASYLFKSNIIIPVIHLNDIICVDNININEINQMDVYIVEKYICNYNIDNFENINSIYELYKLLKDISCNITEDNQFTIIDTSVNNISEIIKKIKRSNYFEIYDVNKRQLQNDLQRVNILLHYNQINDLYQLSNEELIINLKACINIITEIKNNNKYVDFLKENEISLSIDYLNKIYTFCVIYINKYNEYALQQNTILWNYHCNMLSKYYKYLQQFENQHDYIINHAKQHLCNEQQNNEYENTRKKIYFWCQNILHTISEGHTKYEEDVDMYTQSYIELTKNISTLENNKNHYYNDIEEYNKLLNTLINQCNTVENDIDLLKKYKLSLENTRVQTIKNGLKSLETHINNDLETYIDYNMYISFKEATNKSTQFSINIQHRKTKQIIAYDNLSGYEKAIVQFITMHIINTFSPYNFNMFYIDEAFDVFDEYNFNKYISQLLQIAADYSQNVLFVTHRTLPSLTINYTQKTIEQIKNTSFIC